MSTSNREPTVRELPRNHRINRRAVDRVQPLQPPRRPVWPRVLLLLLFLTGMIGAGVALANLREQLNEMERERVRVQGLLQDARHAHVRSLVNRGEDWFAIPPAAVDRLQRADVVAQEYQVGESLVQDAMKTQPRPSVIPSNSSLHMKRVTRVASVVNAQFQLHSPTGKLVPIDAAASVSLTSTDLDTPLMYCVNRGQARYGDVSVAVVMDCSSSMQGEKIMAAQAAVLELIRRLPAGINVCVYRFSNEVTALTPWTLDRQVLSDSVQQLTAEGRTVLLTAIENAVADLRRRGGERHVLLCTDGQDSTGRADMDSIVANARQAQIQIHTVAIAGGDVDQTLLQRLSAATNGTTHAVDTPDSLAQVFGEISERLSEAVYQVTILDPEQRLKTGTLTISDQLSAQFQVTAESE